MPTDYDGPIWDRLEPHPLTIGDLWRDVIRDTPVEDVAVSVNQLPLNEYQGGFTHFIARVGLTQHYIVLDGPGGRWDRHDSETSDGPMFWRPPGTEDVDLVWLAQEGIDFDAPEPPRHSHLQSIHHDHTDPAGLDTGGGTGPGDLDTSGKVGPSTRSADAGKGPDDVLDEWVNSWVEAIDIDRGEIELVGSLRAGGARYHGLMTQLKRRPYDMDYQVDIDPDTYMADVIVMLGKPASLSARAIDIPDHVDVNVNSDPGDVLPMGLDDDPLPDLEDAGVTELPDHPSCRCFDTGS